jgi:hypothetical protein
MLAMGYSLPALVVSLTLKLLCRGVAAEYIGEIAGSRPDWHSRTFQDAGRRHVHVHVEPEQSALAKGGLQALYSQQAQPERRLARLVRTVWGS